MSRLELPEPIPKEAFQAMTHAPSLLSLLRKTNAAPLKGPFGVAEGRARSLMPYSVHVMNLLGLIRLDPSLLWSFNFGQETPLQQLPFGVTFLPFNQVLAQMEGASHASIFPLLSQAQAMMAMDREEVSLGAEVSNLVLLVL